MKNYFHILGLEVGASDAEIRKAFRFYAKKYHPDVNSDENARNQFIEIQQAYSFLINPGQRRNYEALLSEERMSRHEQDRREQIYKLWVEHQQRKARTRDAIENSYYTQTANPFNRKFWRGINVLYNVLALVMFSFILVMPIMNYIDQLGKPENQQRPFIFFLIPAILGAVFIGYGYYYWFVLKTDQE